MAEAWLLFSSGARPEYLENDVRALALLPDTDIQFRYSQRWVSSEFIQAAKDNKIVGSPAYIAYLDDDGIPKSVDFDPAKTPNFVLIREATIAACFVRGSSYILQLTAKRYFNHPTSADLEVQVAALVSPPPLSGRPKCFVVPLSKPLDINRLIEHDNQADNPAHLNAFEATVDKLAQHDDFKKIERGLFANLIDVQDEKKQSVQLVNKKTLQAGKSYKITLYHYPVKTIPLADWKPFWIRAQSDNKNVLFESDINFKIESGYDSREIVFRLDPDMPSERLGIDLRLISGTERGDPILNLYLPFNARRNYFKPAIQAAVIAAGMIIPIVWPDNWGGKTVVAVIGALLVAGTAVSGLKKEL